MPTRQLALLALLPLLLLTACGDDPVRNTPPAPEPATTAEKAIEQLAAAWAELDYGAYEALLHEDFVFYFAQEDIDNNSVPSSSWTRADELSSASRMFSGAGITRTVVSISLDLSPVTDWSDQVAPEFAGTTRKTYHANLAVNYSNGDIGDARGEQVFYIAPVLETVEGNEATVYRVKFWRDLGFSQAPRQAGTESSSWGQIKALF